MNLFVFKLPLPSLFAGKQIAQDRMMADQIFILYTYYLTYVTRTTVILFFNSFKFPVLFESYKTTTYKFILEMY